MLKECSSWVSRNGAVQCFFWHKTEKYKVESLQREKGFWLCCGGILYSISSELKFVKWLRFLQRNCIVKWVIFFASFCWLWDFLLENLKLKNKLWWYPLARVEKYKNFVCPKKYFQKKNSKHEIFESFIFWSDIRFFGGLL